MELTIVIPAYNEEKNISLLYESLKSELSRLKKSYEVIFIDDGSTDKTLEQIKKLRVSDDNVKIISFTKNFRKASALAAGLNSASGNIIVTMDADMQDNPSEVPKLLGKLNEGYDMVVGWKYPRKDPLGKIAASRLFNLLVRVLTGLKIHDCDSNFRVMRRKVIPHLEVYSGLYRYIPVIAHKKGFKVGEIKVKHQERAYGKSKYGLARLPTGLFDLITIKFLLEYNKRPLHLFGGIGSIFLLLGMVSGLYLSYLRLALGQSIGQRPLLILTILLIFLGMQFISIGLIGEMIANLSQRKKEEYVIKEEDNFRKK